MTVASPPLAVTIAQLAEKVRKYGGKGIGEQNTKASLIEPLLECLGWDIRDLDSVHREYRTKSRDKPVDYALKLLRSPRLFIEAKSLGEDLSERKWISQVLYYATVAGVEWCVLTDGNEYRIYNASAALDAEEKLFRKVRIADDERAVVSSTLNLISRSNLEENLLDVHWKLHFVDRRVKAAISEMVDSAHPGLIRLIRKKEPSLAAKAIAGSLARLEVTIEAPPMPVGMARSRTSTSVAGEEAGGQRSAAALKAWETRRKATAEGGRTHVGVTLGQLISSGFLKAPLTLFRKYKGHELNATLLPDGSVEFGGQTYESCSLAAGEARGSVTGRLMHTNGWKFWQYDEGGVKRELDYARQQFLARGQQSATLRLKGSGFHARPLSG